MSHQGLISQLIGLAQRFYPSLTAQELQQHFLDVMEAKTYFIEIENNEVVGYLEYCRVPGTKRALHVTELLVTRPQIIWTLKRRLDALVWDQLMFRRHKTNRWKYHFRRLSYV